MRKPLPLQWTKDLSNKEDKQRFLETLYHNKDNPVLTKLKSILLDKKESLYNNLLKEDYQEQRQIIGRLQEIESILDLLKWMDP